MAPETRFAGDGAMRVTDRGIIYDCPDCGAKAPIRDGSAVFLGGIMALFWGAIGYWAFSQGPLWYGRHFDILLDQGFDLYLLMDAGVLLFYLLLVAVSVWMIWQDLLQPLLIRAGHPLSHENRAQTEEEKLDDFRGRRDAFLNFFVYSLLMWAPLIGLFLILDWLGFDLHGETGQIISMVLAFGVMTMLGWRKPLIFFGMAFWLAVIVGFVFWLG